jgi:Domain of unknown function (DUF4383)
LEVQSLRCIQQFLQQGVDVATRYFSLVIGIVYLLVGIVGFIPSALSPAGLVAPPGSEPGLAVTALHGRLFGLFPVNLLHDVVYVLIGVWGIVAYSGVDRARVFARGLAILYAALAVMGVIPGLDTLFGLVPLHGHDVWLHAGTAAVAAYFGWGVERATGGTARVRA